MAVAVNLAVKPLSLLLENMVQNQIGHQKWGMYTALNAFCFLFAIFADLGVSTYTNQHLASHPEKLQQKLPHIFALKLLLILAYPLLVMAVGALYGYPFDTWLYLAWVAVITSVSSLSEFFRFVVRTLQKFNTDSLLSITEKVIFICVVAILIGNGISLKGFLYARTLSWGLAAASSLWFMLKYTQFARPKLVQEEVMPTLRLSIVFTLMTVLYSINDKIDHIMLQSLYGDHETGLYAGAYRWLDAFNMYLWIVLPLFFSRFAFFVKQPDEQQHLMRYGQLIVSLPLIFVSGFVLAHGEKLLFLFTKSTPEELAHILLLLKILFVGVAINAISAIFSTLLTSTGYTRQTNYIIIATIVQTLIINFLFIPRYGAIASAIATVWGWTFMTFGYMWMIHKHSPVKVPYKQTLLLVILTACVYATFYLLHLLHTHWIASTLIAGLSTLAYVFLLRLLPTNLLQQLKTLLK